MKTRKISRIICSILALSITMQTFAAFKMSNLASYGSFASKKVNKNGLFAKGNIFRNLFGRPVKPSIWSSAKKLAFSKYGILGIASLAILGGVFGAYLFGKKGGNPAGPATGGENPNKPKKSKRSRISRDDLRGLVDKTEKDRKDEEDKVNKQLNEAVRLQEEDNRKRLAAEEQARIEEENRKRLLAEEQARQEEENRKRLAAEEQARQEEENRKRLAAEEQVRIEEENRKRLAAEEQVRIEEENRKRLAAEEQARIEEENRKRLAAEEQARLEEEKKKLDEEIERLAEDNQGLLPAKDGIEKASDGQVARTNVGQDQVDQIDRQAFQVTGMELTVDQVDEKEAINDKLEAEKLARQAQENQRREQERLRQEEENRARLAEEQARLQAEENQRKEQEILRLEEEKKRLADEEQEKLRQAEEQKLRDEGIAKIKKELEEKKKAEDEKLWREHEEQRNRRVLCVMNLYPQNEVSPIQISLGDVLGEKIDGIIEIPSINRMETAIFRHPLEVLGKPENFERFLFGRTKRNGERKEFDKFIDKKFLKNLCSNNDTVILGLRSMHNEKILQKIYSPANKDTNWFDKLHDVDPNEYGPQFANIRKDFEVLFVGNKLENIGELRAIVKDIKEIVEFTDAIAEGKEFSLADWIYNFKFIERFNKKNNSKYSHKSSFIKARMEFFLNEFEKNHSKNEKLVMAFDVLASQDNVCFHQSDLIEKIFANAMVNREALESKLNDMKNNCDDTYTFRQAKEFCEEKMNNAIKEIKDEESRTLALAAKEVLLRDNCREFLPYVKKLEENGFVQYPKEKLNKVTKAFNKVLEEEGCE